MASIQGVSTIQGIQSISFMPVDDAERYIVIANITDGTQQSAIRTLVTYLKSIGAWNYITAMYPVPNSSQASCQVNLKNPGTYDLTFFGGWTFASTGMTPNGTTGYADTGLNPSGIINLDDSHLSIYSRTDIAAANKVPIGCSGGPTSSFHLLFSSASGGVIQTSIGESNPGWFDSTNKHALGSRISSTDVQLYINGADLAGSGTPSTQTMPSLNAYIGANNASGTASGFASIEIAFVTIGLGVSSTMAADIYTGIQAYQTTLGRQV